MVDALRQEHALKLLLRAAQLAKSTFYYQLQCLQRHDKDAQLKVDISELYQQHKQRYGYRRITMALRLAKNLIVNHKKVLRLMNELNLEAVRPKRKYIYLQGSAKGAAVKNILARKFKAKEPDSKLATDITELKFKGKRYYLSPIMDLFNREITAFTISKRPTYSLVEEMLNQVIPQLDSSKTTLLHSDQGWHYRMYDFKRSLANANITQSMSRKGNCYDNVAMESFFATFKKEFFYRFKGKSEKSLMKEIKDYISYYNNERIMLNLKMSPAQYRAQYLSKSVA
ncbi:IS3 family transposase [Thiopseudomonas alkaliphila]|uniref:IS3 family transposase n=1 Tax=Thiopseudomonas alkaliphila TaxID=1697053 RepID=UPI0035710A5C